MNQSIKYNPWHFQNIYSTEHLLKTCHCLIWSRIQNPVKNLRWSYLQKKLTVENLDAWQIHLCICLYYFLLPSYFWGFGSPKVCDCFSNKLRPETVWLGSSRLFESLLYTKTDIYTALASKSLQVPECLLEWIGFQILVERNYKLLFLESVNFYSTCRLFSAQRNIWNSNKYLWQCCKYTSVPDFFDKILVFRNVTQSSHTLHKQ